MFTVCIWLLQFGGVSSSISAFNILHLLQPECLWDQCFHLGLLLGWLETWNISASKSHRTRSVSRPVVTGCVDLLEVIGICCKINCQSRHWECCLSIILIFLKMALVHQFSSSSIWNKLVYCSLHTSSKPAFFRLDVFSKQKIWTADGWALCTQSQSCVSQLTILGHICPFSDNIQGQKSETETLEQSAAYYFFFFFGS